MQNVRSGYATLPKENCSLESTAMTTVLRTSGGILMRKEPGKKLARPWPSWLDLANARLSAKGCPHLRGLRSAGEKA
jgi:hypothetical protein